VIYGILEDDHGNLWLSTNRGLSKFDPQTETFKNYDVKDGLQSNEFNQGAYHKSSSGEMFFGGINGFNAFYPDRIKENSYIPPVVLTSLTQGGEEIDLGKAVEDVIEVTFSWPNNFFGFEFAALSYAQPEDNQYAYMLEGFEESWNYVGARRFGRYTNLPGGTYILRLKGSNNDGIWNEEGVSVTITIVPPFWETWWFRGIIALLLVGSVIGGYRLRVRSIEARSREFENQVANRTKELAALNAIAATVSQSLDLDQVLNDALDKTLEVMEIEAGGIYLMDEEAKVLTVAAQRGFSPQFVAEIDRLKVGEGFSGRVAQSGQPLVVRNASTDPRLTRMVVREEGLRSLAIVPLSSKGKGLGTLFAVTHGYREFTDRDVQLLTSIGHQIGVAVENAQLFETEQRRAEQFRLISKVSRHIISILDVDQLLCEIVRRVSETLGYYMVGIGLIEEDEVVVRTGVGPYWESDKPEPMRLKVGQEGIVGWVAGTGKPLVAPDVTQEPHYYQVLQITETRSELAVPLRAKDKVIGVLDIQSRRLDAFDESDVVVLQSLANQAAMAIENARLFETEQRRAEQFRVISEVGRRIASILDIDEILVQVARLIHQTFDYYHVGIALIEGDEAVYKAGAGALWDDPQFQFRPARLKVGQEGITGWVAAMGKPLLVPDVSQEPRYVWMRDSKTRSELAVPIALKGAVLGVLDVQSTHLNAFDEGDLMMLQSLANQAAVAIENARFFEAEQRRAEQFRVISEVGHHITSILDVNDLLDEIVGLVKETFGYYLVDILLIEGNDLVIRAVAGPPFDDPPFQASRIKVGEEGITGWVAGTGKPFLTSDVSQEPRYLSLSDAIETRSELCVPLKTKDAVIGVLNIESDQLNAFDESDVMVLQSLANQAAVAIENAQLLAAERQRADELEALRTTLTDITAELELSALLQVIVERAAGLLDATGGELGLYDEASQEIRIVVSHNLGEDYVGTRHGLGEGAMGRVAETGEPLIIKDYHTWEGGLPQYPHIRATLAAPLEVGGRLVGVFTTVTIDPDRQFGPADLHLLNLFAQQAAIAIENARLYEQARQLAVVEERQRLARELHDSVTQALYGVRLYSEAAAGQLSLGHADRAAEHLRELQDTAQEALAEMRLLIYELRPSVLEEEGLVAALQARLLAVEGRAGLKTEFKVEGDGQLPPQIEEGLYRIGQEALNNALKHAHARNITVCLRQDERTITLEIADDGIGFDPTTARERGGLGLSAMEERAAGLGGRLIVQSGPREGTRVLVEVFA